MNKLSLGIEFSTQSAKVVLLDTANGGFVYADKFNYEEKFPGYGTSGGVLPSSSPETRHTSPFMLIEALDCAFGKLKDDGIDLASVCAVKLDGMQHCTVCANGLFGKSVGRLNDKKNLIEQLKPSISRKTSPIWEDRSTGEEAEILTGLLEKSGGINKLTGNRAELRFPAAQIMKWAKDSPGEYVETRNIFLLSAFISSILAGKQAPVDTGDGWGTNLNSADIKNPSWSKEAVKAVDSYLLKFGITSSVSGKIGGITDYDSRLGTVSNYFVKRYGINPKAVVLAGTGDNPATLLGCGGEIVISLGSSYTVNGIMPDVKPSGSDEYNVFGYTKGKTMALSCITNGGKVHETFLRKYITGGKEPGKEDWGKYSLMAGVPELKKDEKLMLAYLMDESVPLHKAGFIREGFDESDAAANIRALHVSQALSLKLHSSHLSKIKKFCIVGGSSKNSFLRQAISDVFNAESYSIKNSDFAAPLGCAISGARAVLGLSYAQAAQKFVQRDAGSFLKPGKTGSPAINALLKRYKDLEKMH